MDTDSSSQDGVLDNGPEGPKETKVIYHMDDEDTPYLFKIPKPPSQVTLADFKAQLNRPAIKFFFKSKDEEVGIVKEEVTDDNSKLPLFNGRIVSWLVSGEGSGSDTKSDKAGNDKRSHKGNDEDLYDDTTTLASGISGVPRKHKPRRKHHHKRPATDSVSQYGTTDTGTEIESVWDDSDLSSMASFSTMTSISTIQKNRRKVFKKTRPTMPRVYSSTTLAESTISESMQIITTVLKMDAISFLGISIMGQTVEDGSGGIFVGSIMKGGAVAADGKIQPGDLLLKVNEINFENLTNEEAVKALREVVQQSGPITLTVARPVYDPIEDYNFEPRNEPIQPMDPGSWVLQTNQMAGKQPISFSHGRSPTMSTMTSDSGSQATSNSMPESERDLVTKLTLATPIHIVARVMSSPNSGLERKDHKWLKMVIPNSFLGSVAVDWLFSKVEGFIDRRHSKKYASLMLKDGYIKHTVNKLSFSEQCYYVFGDVYAPVKKKYDADALQKELSHVAISSEGGGDNDTINGLPSAVPWTSSDEHLPSYSEVRHGSKGRTGTPDSASSSASSNGGKKSGGKSNKLATVRERQGSVMSQASTNFTSVSQQRPGGRPMPDVDQVSIVSSRSIAQMRNMCASRVSFQAALENSPCEYFIDYM